MLMTWRQLSSARHDIGSGSTHEMKVQMRVQGGEGGHYPSVPTVSWRMNREFQAARLVPASDFSRASRAALM